MEQKLAKWDTLFSIPISGGIVYLLFHLFFPSIKIVFEYEEGLVVATIGVACVNFLSEGIIHRVHKMYWIVTSLIAAFIVGVSISYFWRWSENSFIQVDFFSRLGAIGLLLLMVLWTIIRRQYISDKKK